MPVQLTKTQPNPATAQRVSEVQAAMLDMCRALAPAAQKCAEEMGSTFEQMRAQRPS